MKFDKENLIQKITSIDKPVLYINEIVFVSDDKDWVNRIYGSSLNIKFVCIHEDGREGENCSEQLVFGTFITSNHKKPLMEVNRLYSFVDAFKSTNDNKCKQWQVIIELKNLEFEQNERLEILITDYTKLQK